MNDENQRDHGDAMRVRADSHCTHWLQLNSSRTGLWNHGFALRYGLSTND
jgi:hypothetical protein